MCFTFSMKRKLVVFSLFLLGAYFVVSVKAFAIALSDQTTAIENPSETQTAIDPGVENNTIYPPIKPIPGRSTAFPAFGQDHYYSVTMRGNGEAVVSLKAVFSNNGEEPLSEITLRVPKVNPNDISAFQVVREPQCIGYQLSPPIEIQNGKTYEQDLKDQISIYPPVKNPQLPCKQYQTTDFYQSWWGVSEYKKAKTTLSGDTITVTLPNEVDPETTGSIILYFRAFGYAKKNIFGAYDLAFESLKVNDTVRNLQVGISVDSDLYLRGAKGKVNYRFDEGIAALKSPQAAEGAMKNSRIDSFYQQIGQGSITKTASNLQSLESYTVKGVYADARFKVYAKEIVKGVLGVLAFLIICFFLVRFVLRKLHAKSVGNEQKSQMETVSISGDARWAIVVFSASFLSSVIIFAYLVFINFFIQRLGSSSFSSDMSSFAVILLIVVSVGVCAFIFLLPGLLVGFKKGFKWGLMTCLLTLFWIVLYFSFFLVFLFLTNQDQTEIFKRTIPL